MKIASIFTTIAILVDGEQDCNYALELLALQDGSDSFAEHVELWASAADELIERLGKEFEEFKIGLSSFTDKPIPKSGYGKYGGWADYKQDYCYKSHVPLTTSVEVMTAGLNDLKNNMGSGMDAPEAQAEAMINAALDQQIGWSDPLTTHTESGRPIVRILMMITDEKAHEQGDGKSNIASFNQPRSYPNGWDEPSTGGFGAHDFLNKLLISAYLDEESMALYQELADLFAKSDRGEAEGTRYLSSDEQMRMNELIDLWGPYPYPDSLQEHPGDASMTDCSQTDYPSLTQSMEALASRNILPVILTSTDTAYAFYEWYQENVFSNFNISTVISMFNSATLFDDMISAISSVVEKECLIAPTSTPVIPPVTQLPPVTELPPVTQFPPVTELPPVTQLPPVTESQGEMTSHVPGEVDTMRTSSLPADEQESTFVMDDESTIVMDDSSANVESTAAKITETELVDTDETTEFIQPPVVPPAGSNVGTIAGASAGAVAGAAGIAALLYKQFGASLFGGSSAPTVDAGQMEATPDVMEREALEEVTTDMFH